MTGIETIQRQVLGVIRGRNPIGGTDLRAVRSELALSESAVAAAWQELIDTGLIERGGVDPVGGERRWRISDAGWTALEVDHDADDRRAEVINRLGILGRIGDPALASHARLASYVSGGAAAAVHIFDERYQYRVAAHRA